MIYDKHYNYKDYIEESDLVTSEIAEKLEKIGFPIKHRSTGIAGFATSTELIRPLISRVLKWLRKEKEIHIVIDIWGRTWGYDILSLPSGESLHWTAYEEKINSYEKAALTGIEYVLDNLI